MSDELPQGWATAQISDVTERVPNLKPEDTPNKEFGYVDISSIDNSSFVITEVKRFKGKNAMRRHFRILAVVFIVLLTAVAWLVRPLPPEPVQNGHRLSEWLDFYDSSCRFETNDSRHPPFTDAEIDSALDNIGTNALPFLRRWLVAKPDRLRPWCNAQFSKLGLYRFRFAVDHTDYATIAEYGFVFYGATAQPLLPWLTELSHSANAETRMLAYEAAFFTEPERDVFLPLADRALSDKATGCQAAAAQWMVERFPEEAAKRNLRAR